jgi:hypothetical protein
MDLGLPARFRMLGGGGEHIPIPVAVFAVLGTVDR